jgi:YcxB-like protein
MRDCDQWSDDREGGVLDVQLTADDLVAANFVASRWTRWRWLGIGLIFVAWLVIGTSELLSGDEPFSGDALFYFALIPLMMLGLVLSRYWYVPRHSRRTFAQTKSLQRPFRWAWNEEQLSCTSDLANAIVPWADLVKWREGDDVFLLYPSNVMFYIFPKRAFQDVAAIDAFRALLKAKVAATAKSETAF